MMRPGPKFEIFIDMAIQNIQVVARRLGVTRLSVRQYNAHGSFHSRVLTRKWRWSDLCRFAGLQVNGKSGRPRAPRRACMECEERTSETVGPYCRTCKRRIRRNTYE